MIVTTVMTIMITFSNYDKNRKEGWTSNQHDNHGGKPKTANHPEFTPDASYKLCKPLQWDLRKGGFWKTPLEVQQQYTELNEVVGVAKWFDFRKVVVLGWNLWCGSEDGLLTFGYHQPFFLCRTYFCIVALQQLANKIAKAKRHIPGVLNIYRKVMNQLTKCFLHAIGTFR